MTAVSFSMSRGVDGFKMSDVTVGSSAPGTGDVELRFQVLDGQSKNMNDLEIIKIIEAFRRWLLTNGKSAISITTQPSGPPN
jgi:hypothetical protein